MRMASPLRGSYQAAPGLTATGTCPGLVTFDGANLTPLGPVAVLRSTALGVTVAPSGPCAGTASDLLNPQIAWQGNARADGTIHGAASLSSCTSKYQLADVTTCTLSNVVDP
jgi:hypothetical protein